MLISILFSLVTVSIALPLPKDSAKTDVSNQLTNEENNISTPASVAKKEQVAAQSQEPAKSYPKVSTLPDSGSIFHCNGPQHTYYWFYGSDITGSSPTGQKLRYVFPTQEIFKQYVPEYNTTDFNDALFPMMDCSDVQPSKDPMTRRSVIDVIVDGSTVKCHDYNKAPETTFFKVNIKVSSGPKQIVLQRYISNPNYLPLGSDSAMSFLCENDHVSLEETPISVPIH